MPENRRTQTRHQVSLAATLLVSDTPHERTIINLSLGGCHIAHPARLPIGTRVDVLFHIPTQEQPIEIGGAARWSSDVGVGIQFDGLRAREVWSLNQYFESLQN